MDYDLSSYTDAGKLSDWAVVPFKWAVSVGVINGMSETELAPQGTAMRCQAAVIFARFARLIEG